MFLVGLDIVGDKLMVDERSNKSRRLAKQFENFIFPVLDEIQETSEKQGFADRPVEQKKSLWKLLG